MKRTFKVLSVLLALVMIVGMLPVISFAASEPTYTKVANNAVAADGTYVFVTEHKFEDDSVKNYALSGINAGKITPAEVTVTSKGANTYTIQSAGSPAFVNLKVTKASDTSIKLYYNETQLGYSGKKTDFTTSTGTAWEIESKAGSSDLFMLKSGTRGIGLNAGNTPMTFGCYAGSNANEKTYSMYFTAYKLNDGTEGETGGETVDPTPTDPTPTEPDPKPDTPVETSAPIYRKVTDSTLTSGKYVMIVDSGKAPKDYRKEWVYTADPVCTPDKNWVTDDKGAVMTITTVDNTHVKLADCNGVFISPLSSGKNGITKGEYSWPYKVSGSGNNLKFTFGDDKTAALALNNNFRTYKKYTNYEHEFSLYKLVVAKIGDAAYFSLSDALNNAKPNETIKLTSNVEDAAADIVVPANVSIDLNGHTVNVKSFTMTNGSNIVDTSADHTGRLNVPGGIVLAKDNSQMPVKMTDGYMFVKPVLQQENEIALKGSSFSFKFRPALESTEMSTDLLGTAAAGHELQIILRISYTKDGKSGSFDCIMSQQLLTEVYGSTDALAFAVNVSGVTEAFKDIKVSTVVKSNTTNVEAVSTPVAVVSK